MSSSRPQHPNADVRMRGFRDRVSAEEAVAWLDAELRQIAPLSAETIPLSEAVGRVLSANLQSRENVPNFERAMMDGFAVCADDIRGASAENPIPLKVIGECYPGRTFAGEFSAGSAVRIMTGAPLPAGVDVVVPVELTECEESHVNILRALPAGKNFGSIGEDIRSGDVVLQKGRRLRPQDVGVLSSIGQGEVPVVRRPQVRILVTGDELLPAGTQPIGCQIVDANGPMLNALVQRDSGLPRHPGIVSDDRQAILSALRDEVDVVLVSGGSSVGQEDFVPTILAEHGQLAIHGISMRPASPMGMGHFEGRLIFLLPGNPVACLWGYDLLAGRAIRQLAGGNAKWPYREVRATLACDVVSPIGRMDYIRVHLSDERRVEPVASSGASVLSSTTRADGFIVVPTQSPGYEAEAMVEVFLYDS